jgi:hypothetical protein
LQDLVENSHRHLARANREELAFRNQVCQVLQKLKVHWQNLITCRQWRYALCTLSSPLLATQLPLHGVVIACANSSAKLHFQHLDGQSNILRGRKSFLLINMLGVFIPADLRLGADKS